VVGAGGAIGVGRLAAVFSGGGDVDDPGTVAPTGAAGGAIRAPMGALYTFVRFSDAVSTFFVNDLIVE
jgi:hypothetical protein